jgi:hypothetical protein
VHSTNLKGRNKKGAFDAQQFIDWLVEANIFVIPLDDQDYWRRVRDADEMLPYLD